MFTDGKFLRSKTKFTSAEQIPQDLLESVSTCYSQRVQACRWCFLTYLPSTVDQLQSVVTTHICRKCLRNNGTITVMPASDLCETSPYGKFVAIPPTPEHTDKIRAFCYCNKYKKAKVSKHKKCLLLTRKGNAWFPHSIEEMVIWTIEYKQGELNNLMSLFCSKITVNI